MQLSSASNEVIAAFARNTELDKATRDAFSRIVTLQSDVARHQQRLTILDNERKTIVSDQERLRGNLGSVPRDSDLYKRYLAKLEEQENALEKLAKDRTATEQALTAARQALSEFIAKL
jgi:chromosome segregation ATPase